MITIKYFYKRKRDGKWCSSIAIFRSVRKAERFIRSMNSPNKESFVDSWDCDDPWDNEYLWSRVPLTDSDKIKSLWKGR